MNSRWLLSQNFLCVWLSHPSLGTPTDHSSPHLLVLALVQKRCRFEVVWRSSSHSEWILRSWWWWIQSCEEYALFLEMEFHLPPSQQQSSLHQEWTWSVPPYITALQLSSLQNQTFAAAPPFNLASPVVPVETAVFLLPTAATVAEHDLAHAPHSPHSVLKTVSR